MQITPKWVFVRMPAELKLLVDCLRCAAGNPPPNGPMGPLITKGIDWEALLGLVNQHRVPGPVFKELRFRKGIPDSVLAHLQGLVRHGVYTNLLKAAELTNLVRRFKAARIPVLAFKGPVAGLQTYGDLGSRHIGDLDIMIPGVQLAEADDVLQKAGYYRSDPNFELSPRQWIAFKQRFQHFAYRNPQKKIAVELHWRHQANRYLLPLKFQDFWKNRQSLSIGGHPIDVFSFEHTFFSLCTHGSNHGWGRLFWLNDIALLLHKHPSLDCASLMQSARHMGIDKIVAESVMLSHLLLGAPMPGEVALYARQRPGIESFIKKSLTLICIPGYSKYPLFSKPFVYNKLHRFHLRNDLPYRVAFCINELRPPIEDWRRFPMPDFLFGFYYLIRPFTWFFSRFLNGASSSKKPNPDAELK